MGKSGLIAAAALSAVLVASPVAVQASDVHRVDSAEDAMKDAQRLAKEAAERLLTTLRLLLEYVPQYEMPEVLDNGDIIIRRKQPQPTPEGTEPDDDHTKT